jgi:hypothetical protein
MAWSTLPGQRARSTKGTPVSFSLTILRPEASQQRTVEETTTGLDLFGDDRTVVAMRVNGEVRDLARELADGDEVEPILISSDEGLYIVRHSAAHVAAQALQNLRADAKLGIGPPITDGFYYDFQTEPLTPTTSRSSRRTWDGSSRNGSASSAASSATNRPGHELAASRSSSN